MPKTTLASAPNEVAELLRTALAQLRTIRAAPPDDTQARLLLVFSQLFGLTATQSRALVALMKHGQVSREAMHAAMAHDGIPASNIKTVSVIIGTMRKKLEPFGIEVITVWGIGFRLGAGAGDRVNRLLAGHGGAAIEQVAPMPD
jgi:DNA-binding response OmpR family regulator